METLKSSSQNTLTFNLDKKITRQQLLRQKIDNLCRYMKEQFPNKELRICELQKSTEEKCIVWIIQNIVPYANAIDKLVETLYVQEGITANKEVTEKLKRYCEFFTKIVQ